MKRGQGLSLNTIVLAVLALIVLFLLIWLFRTHLQKGSQKYVNITSEAEREARTKEICESMFALRTRNCVESEAACTGKGLGFNPVKGAWSDCNAKYKTATSVCCEAP
jgi:hypothetical protein